MKSGYLIWLAAVTTCLVALIRPGDAKAEQLRAALLVKHTVEGQSSQEAPLESAALGALASAGLRLVEIDTALTSQKALFSDMVQAGTLPPALSTLNADALVSVQLSCDKNGANLLGSGFQSYFCSLQTKVVRIDTGDVVFTRSQPLPTHGLNTSMAVQGLLKSKVPDALAAQSKEWLSAWGGASGFSLDLMVSGVPDLHQRDLLRDKLAQLAGVAEVQGVYFRDGLVKLTIRGQGESELRMLPKAIEESDLALRITREAGRTVYAQVDTAKAYARGAVFYLELPAEGDVTRALVEEVGPDLLQTALRNLPYLSPIHSRPLAGGPRSVASLAKLVLANSRRDFALVVAARVRREGTLWTSQLTVSDLEGAPLSHASGTGEDMAQAIEASARVLDGAMLAALAKPEVRQRIGLRDRGGPIRSPNLMVVERFQVRGDRDGLLDLRNASISPLSDCSVELKVAGLAAGQVSVPDLPPGKAHTVPFSFTTLPRGLDEDAYTNVSATVRYRAGEAYGDTRAEAVWMRAAKPESVGPRVKSPATEATRSYEQLTRDGVAASRRGDWKAAKTLFLRAHNAQPTARTLRALGLVSFDLGDYEQAGRYMRDALASTVKPLTPTMQAQLRELLQRAAESRSTSALARTAVAAEP